MKKLLITTLTGALAAVGAYGQTTVDFSGLPLLTDVTTQYAPQGVTFSGADDSANPVNIQSYGNTGVFGDVGAPFVLSDYFGGDPINNRARDMFFNFTSPASDVSFGYNPAGDAGNLTIFEAFSPTDVLLASFSDPNAITADGTFYTEGFGSLSGIGSIEIISPQSGWGHYVADLQFTETATGTVPDGGLTIAMLGTVAGLMAAARRRLS